MSKKVKEGYMQVGVEVYGGGIWPSWFDRDLSLAGRVIVSTPGQEKKFTSRLIKIDRPLLRIPTLAIHLDRTINEAFKFNKETEFKPILGLVSNALNDTGEKETIPFSGTGTPNEQGGDEEMAKKDDVDVAGMKERHHPMMLAVLADELGCSVGDIQDFELWVVRFDGPTALAVKLDGVSWAWSADVGIALCTIHSLRVSVDCQTSLSSVRGSTIS